MKMRIKNISISTTLLFSGFVFAQASVDKGKELYNQTGANSCQYCHGATGEGGSVKAAAKLSQPTTWKIYKILGGKAEYTKNKADFLAKMKEATVALITKGSILHNATFKKPWFDLKKAGANYDAQMLGIQGAPSKQWIKKSATPDAVAAESSYLFVQTLDKEKVFK
ncbi:MAG: hypothetical protein KA116_00415 [Proteobacteria bacterium]|nr:hypothetical protein [Pseudomonadota bacterium]